MTSGEMEFLALVIGAFVLFGGVMGWASWDESRRARKARKHR